MNYSLSNAKQIEEIILEIRENLMKIAPLSQSYSTKLKNATEKYFFASIKEGDKKDISRAYFQFGIEIKNILAITDWQTIKLTEVMIEADLNCCGTEVLFCDRVLKEYMMLKNHFGLFCSRTEEILSASETVSLNNLSLELQRILAQTEQTCLLIETAVNELCLPSGNNE